MTIFLSQFSGRLHHNIGIDIFILIVMVIIVLTSYFSRGISFGYLNSISNSENKNIITFIHIITSVLTGLILPNNYYNKLEYIEQLFQETSLLIPVFMVITALIIMILLGALLTILTRRKP